MSENVFKIFPHIAEPLEDMILAKQLKNLLHREDATVAQLARATKISAKTIYQWLQGQNPRDLKQVRKVADYFSVSIDFLAFGIEPKTKNSFTDYSEEINAGQFEVILRKIKA